MDPQPTVLHVSRREERGSRAARRLRRAGYVPCVVYGGDDASEALTATAPELRQALAARGAVIELASDGGGHSAVVLKAAQYHPVRGDLIHADFLRVRRDVAIESIVPIELVGAEDAPGVRSGGIVAQQGREVKVLALPADIPDRLTVDISSMEIGDTVVVADVELPPRVELADPEDRDTVVATLTTTRKTAAEAAEAEAQAEAGAEGEAAGEEGEQAEGTEQGDGGGSKAE